MSVGSVRFLCLSLEGEAKAACGRVSGFSVGLLFSMESALQGLGGVYGLRAGRAEAAE